MARHYTPLAARASTFADSRGSDARSIAPEPEESGPPRSTGLNRRSRCPLAGNNAADQGHISRLTTGIARVAIGAPQASGDAVRSVPDVRADRVTCHPCAARSWRGRKARPACQH